MAVGKHCNNIIMYYHFDPIRRRTRDRQSNVFVYEKNYIKRSTGTGPYSILCVLPCVLLKFILS